MPVLFFVCPVRIYPGVKDVEIKELSGARVIAQW